MRRSSNSIAALCAAALIASAAVVGLVTGGPSPRPHTKPLAIGRADVAVSYPDPAGPRVARGEPVRWTGPAPASVDCPQMTNPGGHNIITSPGPDGTDGNVSLPSIGVNAPIVRVGFDGNGNMVLPHDARDVAWLDQGPFPGSNNNVVLAGHIAWGGVPGSFGTIDRLHPGDVVTIVLHGKTWKYAVRYSCLFPFNSPRGLQVIGYTPVPSLTMVSCAGTWNAAAGTHNERIVVRAEQIYPPVPHPAPPHAGSPSSKPKATPAAPGSGLPAIPLRS